MERSKLYKILGIIVGAILLIILFVVVFTLLNGNKMSYSEVEDKIVEATKEYYANHVDLLPATGKTETVSTEVLHEEGLMESLDELIKKTSCTGFGKVYNNGVENVYSSSLNCGKVYSSVSAIDYLKSKNEIKVDGSGLYEMTLAHPVISEESKVSEYVYNTEVEQVTRYVYRGKDPNNYVKFDKQRYQIVSFSEEGIKIIKNLKKQDIFDNRYNEITDSNEGKNDYGTSKMLYRIEEAYDDLPSSIKSVAIPQTLCIGGREDDSLVQDGVVECKKVIVKQNGGLLAAYETVISSLDENCKTNAKSCENANYISDLGSTWTSTPLINTTTYEFIFNGELYSKQISRDNNYFLTIMIDPKVKVSGSGTWEDPFVMEG